jgi:tetratricopeptide (TPR) repeat protein
MTSQSSQPPSINIKELRQCIECDTCEAPNPTKRCSQCRCTFYCSVQCQKVHWTENNHKMECIPCDEMKLRMVGVKDIESGLTSAEQERQEPINTSCSICFAEPIVNPVVLSGCLHAFCFTCVTEWQKYENSGLTYAPSNSSRISSSSYTAANKRSGSCPYCRQTVQKSTVEEAMEKVVLYASAGRLVDKNYDPIFIRTSNGDDNSATASSTAENQRVIVLDKRQQKFCDLAIAQINQILISEPNHLQALCLKGQTLRHIHPSMSIEAFQKALEIDQRGHASLSKLIKIKSQIFSENPSGEERTRLMEEYEEIAASDSAMAQIGEGPFRLYLIQTWLAEAYESDGNYVAARRIYKTLLQDVYKMDYTEYTEIDPPTNRMMLSGASRCSFQLQDYGYAKDFAEMALAMNRHFPGIHQLLAQAQWALNDKENALRTMKRGILYETPWDEENQQRNVTFLNEILALSDT